MIDKLTTYNSSFSFYFIFIFLENNALNEDCTPDSSAYDVAHKMIQTSSALSSKSPRKTVLKKKIHSLRVLVNRRKKKLELIKQRLFLFKKRYCSMNVVASTIDSIVKAASKFLNTDCLSWLEMQLRMAKRSPRGRRYSNYAKQFALNLYSHGPKAYRFLSSIYALPSKSTLSVWLQSMQVQPGISNDLMRATSIRAECFQPRDRVCALMIDEMSIKSLLSYDKQFDVVYGFQDCGESFKRENLVATSAVVFMVCELSLSWKQPVGYVLTKSACKGDVLMKLLYQFLDSLHAIGLIVKVLISDQGSNFQSLTSLLGITVETPYFIYNDRKYWYMFDTPHLLKSVRNNLFKYRLTFSDNKSAEWKHIREFFHIDQKQRFRLAPRLTQKHIELPAFSKMKVKTAAQVFSTARQISRSVAAA